MRGVIARALQQPRDVGQLGVEPVGLSDRPILGTVADIVDETDLGGEPPGEQPGARRRKDRRRVINLRPQHSFARVTVEVRGLYLDVPHHDPQSVVYGTSVSVRVTLGWCRYLYKNKRQNN